MSLPKKQQTNLKTKEYFRQSFRTGKTYPNQQKLTTETSKDIVESPKTPESEFVRPYDWVSYKEMEYFLLAPQGQADAREETPWDTPWAQLQDSDARDDYYSGVEDIPDVADLFFTSKDLLFVPLGSDGLRVKTPHLVVFYEGFNTSNIVPFVTSDSGDLNVRT